MLLGASSTAVQRASAGGSGGSRQQADGQVCRKVSAWTALPVRWGEGGGERWGEVGNNGGKILRPPPSPPIHFHTLGARWRESGAINHFSFV